MTFWPVKEIGGVTAATTCSYAGEAMPVASHNQIGGYAAMVAFQNVFAAPSGIPYPLANNWTNDDRSTWSTQKGIPNLPPYMGGGGDPWSTTSAHSGLEYASQIGSYVQFGQTFYCLSIGSTTWTDLQNGRWTNPYQCQSGSLKTDFPDGPSIYYDDTNGGHNLMGASAGAYEHLYIWPHCAGQPTTVNCSSGPCGLCTFTNVTDNSGTKLAGGHATVRAHNNHDVMVAFRSNSGDIHLVFYTPSGSHVNDWVVRTGVPLAAVAACQSPSCSTSPNRDHGFVPKVGGCNSTDCDAPPGKSGQGGCMRIADKVHLATQYTGGHQYAYLTYTMTCAPGDTSTKAFLDVADVTNPSAPTLLFTWVSGSCSTSIDNDFEPVFLAGENGQNVFAWGFYTQYNGNPADTRFLVYTATDPTLATFTSGAFVDSGFPTLIVDNSSQDNGGIFDYGLGDYVGGAPDEQGNLFFTYGRPVVTTATTCPAPMNSPTVCGGKKYSVALYEAMVTPP